jgi:hypothetical protein
VKASTDLARACALRSSSTPTLLRTDNATAIHSREASELPGDVGRHEKKASIKIERVAAQTTTTPTSGRSSGVGAVKSRGTLAVRGLSAVICFLARRLSFERLFEFGELPHKLGEICVWKDPALPSL